MSTLGMECLLKYKVGGQSGGGSWLELDAVMDVSTALSKATTDTTTRANSGYRAKRGTLREAPITANLLWNPANAGALALLDVFSGAEDMIGIQVCEPDGNVFFQADYDVVEFGRDEPLEEAVKIPIKLEITDSDDPPQLMP